MIHSYFNLFHQRLAAICQRFNDCSKSKCLQLCLIFILLGVNNLLSATELLAKKSFNIPKQKAVLSLINFAEQAEITLLFPVENIQNIMANPLVGSYSIITALQLLLKDSGLQMAVDNSGRIAIYVDKNSLKESSAIAPSKDKADIAHPSVERITVKGIKGSIKYSINYKRLSNEILDVISTEDIGQLPDENIADALQRIPGIQMSRSANGEGSTIQIRGISYNNVEVNGHTLSGSAPDRSVNFQDIPSELVSSIEILKAPTSDKIEGSLSGTINLKLSYPLANQAEQIFSVTSKVKYSTFNSSVEPNFYALLAKNWRNTKWGDFGIIVNGGTKTISTLTEAFGGGDFSEASGSWSLQSGNMLTQAPFTANKSLAASLDINGDGEANSQDRFYVPNEFRFYSNERESVRNTFNSTLQWQPNNEINLFFNMMFSDSEEDTHNAQYGINLNKALALPQGSGDNHFASLGHFPVGEHHIMTAGRLGGATVTSGSTPSLNTTWRESEQFTLGGDIQVTDNLKLSAELSSSDAKSWSEQSQLTMGYDANLDGKLKDNDSVAMVDFDTRGVDLADVTLYESAANLVALDPTDTRYEHMFYEKYQRNAGNNDNTADAFRIDASYELDDGIITEVSVGARWAERTFARKAFKDTNKTIQNVPVYPLNANKNTNDVALATSVAFIDCLTPTSRPALSGQSGDMPRNWTSTSCDIDFFTEHFGSDDIRTVNPDTGAGIYEKTFDRFNITDETMAYYLRADFSTELFGKDVYGNFGARYIETDTMTEGFADINGSPQWVTIDGNYNNLLPSLNANMALNDEMILRFAYADVLARPGLSDLKPGIKLSTNDTIEEPYDGTGQAGNPDLDAITATNIDLAFEWYYQEASMLSAALFYKNIDSNIAFGPEPIDMSFNDELYSVRQKQNIAGTELEGIELNVVQAFDFLPGFLHHTGISINYTYTHEDTDNIDGEGEAIARQGLSENSYNLVAFYDDEKFSVRLAYNWRSEFVRREYVQLGFASEDTLPEIEAARGQLDLTANYKINKHFKINFAAVNLNESITERYLKHQQLTNYIADSGIRYNLGFIANF